MHAAAVVHMLEESNHVDVVVHRLAKRNRQEARVLAGIY